jgi:hypothetical protein
MRCQTARQWITRHLAGELTPGRIGRLERHVERCEGCRREQVAYAALERALGLLPLAATVSPRLEQDTLRRIRVAAAAPPAPRRGWLRIAVPALAGVAAIAVALRLTPSPSRPAAMEAERLANLVAPKRTEVPAIKRDAPPAPSAPRRRREPTVPSEPPAELAARPDLFVNLPLLRNMEKLTHYDAIQTTTLDDQSEDASNG